MIEQMLDEKKYYISVYTSALPNAGIPTSNLFIQLFGKHGKKYNIDSKNIDKRDSWILKFPLVKSQNAKKFMPGQCDRFEIEEINVGKISKIRLSHDSKSSWHLKKVLIKINDKKLKFYCNKPVVGSIDLLPIKELSTSDESDYDFEKKNEQKTTIKLEQTRYDLKIKTSEFSKSVSSSLDLKLIGHRGETNKIKLNNTPSDKEKEKFLPDSLDFFKMVDRNIGVLERIFLYCKYDQDNKPSDWFFDYIYIDIPSERMRYKFDTKSRTQIMENIEKFQTILEVFPIESKPLSKVKLIYKIELHMKKNNRSKEIDRKKEKEEIIENLSAQIFGDFGKTAEVKVSDKKVNCIDPGVDVFHFHSENSDLGSLFKIKLTQTNPKKNKPIWYLERIRVLHNKQVWSFPYQRWITMNKKEKKKEIKIFEENYRKSRKDFFAHNKFSRTVSTLSHRLLTDETINDDSYDDSFEETRSNSTSRSPVSPRRSRSISPRKTSSEDRGRTRERKRSKSNSRSRSNSSIEDRTTSVRPRRRSRTISIDRSLERERTNNIDRNMKADLEKRLQALKQDVIRPSESNRLKEEKLQEYVDFKIEDKFEKRYPNLKKDLDLDYKYKVENDPYDPYARKRTSENFRNKELYRHQENPTEHDLDERFKEFKPEKSLSKYDLNKFETKPSQMSLDNFSVRNSQKNHDALYNIAEEVNSKPKFDEIRKFPINDLKLDLSKRKPAKVFEFDDEKELNKIYESFFNEDTKKPSVAKNKSLSKINEDSFRKSYMSEMNSFNTNTLNESYRPTFK